ncbi:peptidylprolyl isomerase [Formicincola oecophyllae]|uniref:Parvulin-like PPIase n=1 Tax=Formicincola oecophyllae TaxID=2558361 RepID=A0A4Y6U8J9_9PROT|nr:peptidylprolyl isomerase [Formicincola oecophyllae]QDH13773.1 peptidylprolyl isomerase [Formicincola oecophyllae]
MRHKRLSHSIFSGAALALCALSTAPSLAQAANPQAPAAPAKAAANPNMTIASVNGEKITLGDVQKTIQSLPPAAQSLRSNPTVLVPIVVNQLIDQKVIQAAAIKDGLENKPDVKAAMQSAADAVLQNAYLEQKVRPMITDSALKAYYDKHYADRKPEEEIHARHILVNTKEQADSIIKQLDKGADFSKLAAADSADKGTAAQNGGDLGWFKRGDMIPAFSDAAFTMKPGSISQTPVHTQYGWHVIQVLGTRTAPVPSFAQEKDRIRAILIRDDVKKVIDNAQKAAKVVRYDVNGKVVPAK